MANPKTIKHREALKRWAARDPEAVKAYRRRKRLNYYARHPEKTKKAEYHEQLRRDPQRVRARVKRANQKRRERYRDELNRRVNEWYRKHPEARAAINGRRRLRELGQSAGPINFSRVVERCAGVCGICEEPVEGRFHFDHIVPIALGGAHSEENLQIAHPTCNLKKGARYVA